MVTKEYFNGTWSDISAETELHTFQTDQLKAGQQHWDSQTKTKLTHILPGVIKNNFIGSIGIETYT